jgi:tRNA A-37 threonylcarbamoyl transferase component Bud32
MGVVYRATQIALNRRVALKAIAPKLAGDLSYRERFQRESELTASIDHPNVIPIYGAGESHGTLYLIMRWVEGTDLRRLLDDEKRLDPARAIRLLRPVVSALAAAHRRGLVHRDIKPGNVLIAQGEGDDDHVYLTDFGIAQRAGVPSGLTATGVLVGTLDYAAPERLTGGQATPASDIYAFGCMLFETLTGEVPFVRPAEFERVEAHLNDPAPSARAVVPEVPAELDRVIARALAKDPAARFADAGELASALDAVASPATPTAATTPVTPPPPRRSRLDRRLVAAAATAVAAAIAAIVVVSTGGGANRRAATHATSKPAHHAPSALVAHPPVTLDGAVAAMSSDNAGTVWAAISNGAEAIVDGRLQRFNRDGHPAAGRSQPTSASLLAADRQDGIVFTGTANRTIERAGTNATAAIKPPFTAMAYGEGWLWLGRSDGMIERRHRDLSPGGSFNDGPHITALAFNGGVWASQVNGDVTRFDPRKLSIGQNATIAVAPGHPLTAIAAIDGQPPTPVVWTISRATRTLYEISYAHLKVIASLRLSSTPVELAAISPRSVWVATTDNQVIEVTTARK